MALFNDSQSVIHLMKNLMFHARTKQLQLMYYLIRELMDEGMLLLRKVPRSSNASEMLAKVVGVEKSKLCLALTGLQFH